MSGLDSNSDLRGGEFLNTAPDFNVRIHKTTIIFFSATLNLSRYSVEQFDLREQALQLYKLYYIFIGITHN